MQLLVVQNGTVYESVGLAAGAGQVRGVWKDRVLVIVIKHQARNLHLSNSFLHIINLHIILAYANFA
jgi:hypothetical protein